MDIGFIQVAVTLVLILLLVKPAGSYLVHVFDYGNGRTRIDRLFGWAEKPLYRLMGVKEDRSVGGRAIWERCFSPTSSC